MTGRFTRLAELSVHGANVQEGQIVLVQAEIGLEEQARATAEAAYKRGAKFVDVAYFDPYLKRVRIESANPDTLDFVPQWYGERVLEHAEQNDAVDFDARRAWSTTRTQRCLRSLSASASRHCSSVSVAVCGRAGIAVAPASSAWNKSNSASSCESGIRWASQA